MWRPIRCKFVCCICFSNKRNDGVLFCCSSNCLSFVTEPVDRIWIRFLALIDQSSQTGTYKQSSKCKENQKISLELITKFNLFQKLPYFFCLFNSSIFVALVLSCCKISGMSSKCFEISVTWSYKGDTFSETQNQDNAAGLARSISNSNVVPDNSPNDWK